MTSSVDSPDFRQFREPAKQALAGLSREIHQGSPSHPPHAYSTTEELPAGSFLFCACDTEGIGGARELTPAGQDDESLDP